MGDSLPGEGKHAGLSLLGSLLGGALGAGRGHIALPPVAAVSDVTPITGGGCGAPGHGVRALVLQSDTLTLTLSDSDSLSL